MGAGRKTPARIEVQKMGEKFIGLVRTWPKGVLLSTCGHTNHKTPGEASNCAEALARRQGREIVE